jgi:hypothetical protein
MKKMKKKMIHIVLVKIMMKSVIALIKNVALLLGCYCTDWPVLRSSAGAK